jgi:hypothetical protein
MMGPTAGSSGESAMAPGAKDADDVAVSLPLPSRRYRVQMVAVLVLGISPPVICALLANSLDRWDLFERSGSITTAVGLLVASRRYIRHGVLELTNLHLTNECRSNAVELLEDVLTGKLGLALSAFGTIVWGWGKYLGWWSFGYLLGWALFAIRDLYRDSAGRRRLTPTPIRTGA